MPGFGEYLSEKNLLPHFLNRKNVFAPLFQLKIKLSDPHFILFLKYCSENNFMYLLDVLYANEHTRFTWLNMTGAGGYARGGSF